MTPEQEDRVREIVREELAERERAGFSETMKEQLLAWFRDATARKIIR